ncbi:MAG: 4Fe-4S dicluster domain-containing protein, partial [Gammaproteobacteria bacterium]
MLLHDRAYRRGVELGPYPFEALPTASEPASGEARPRSPQRSDGPMARAAQFYAELFSNCMEQEPAPPAPVPEDLARRARELKGAAYYLDAAHAGICEVAEQTWTGDKLPHSHALVVCVAYGREIEPNNLAHGWIAGAEHDIALMRVLEIAASLTGHIRALGFEAHCHREGTTQVDLDQLLLAAGVAVQDSEGRAVSPFIGERFAAAAITTDYALTCDAPLAPGASISRLRNWLGINGAVSGRERNRQRRRKSHLSKYPMEQVRRVDQPTTLIFDDEVPRVPKRAEFFMRARMGDLGEKAQREVRRFAFKHPLTDGMMHPLRAMVPHQDGAIAEVEPTGFDDPQANAEAIKSLSYHLGADLTGICEIPRYAWYSHDAAGNEVANSHKYAVVMLIDQGYDTMEGASGDDWISGCQSMRGYIRGAEIAGVMAEFLRANGISARPQTNADSEVLQIPLVLLAGLGELSRIGELVLNPFVGPRFKSVVLTTNLPLVPDKPIDFGLQYFCSHCLKCARECPVNAIPFGDKVMFNGYEIWKPDVERCTRYRVTNPKGSACGRCMKTCPLNKVVSADGALTHRIGTWLGI